MWCLPWLPRGVRPRRQQNQSCQLISRSSAGSDRSWSPRSRRQGVSLPTRRPALFERREHQRNVRRTAFQPSADPRGVRCHRRQLHHFKGRRRAGSIEFQPDVKLGSASLVRIAWHGTQKEAEHVIGARRFHERLDRNGVGPHVHGVF